MHQITFDVKARLQMPVAEAPDLQSIYVFNMYRAGSSMTEAVAIALAESSDYTPYNAVQALNAVGIGLIDHQDYNRPSVFIDDAAPTLDQLGTFGGYLYFGFREIPHGYGERFRFPDASVIVVRDIRDIGISQYAAVAKHAVAGASGEDILRLREMTASQDLEQFLLSEGTIAFLRRISSCYRPLIHHGSTVLRYEEFMTPGGFDTGRFLDAVAEALAPYLQLRVSREQTMEILQARMANSKALKGHATGGRINLHLDLPKPVHTALTNALAPELDLLGYL